MDNHHPGPSVRRMGFVVVVIPASAHRVGLHFEEGLCRGNGPAIVGGLPSHREVPGVDVQNDGVCVWAVLLIDGIVLCGKLQTVIFFTKITTIFHFRDC